MMRRHRRARKEAGRHPRTPPPRGRVSYTNPLMLSELQGLPAENKAREPLRNPTTSAGSCIRADGVDLSDGLGPDGAGLLDLAYLRLLGDGSRAIELGMVSLSFRGHE